MVNSISYDLKENKSSKNEDALAKNINVLEPQILLVALLAFETYKF